MAVPRVIGSWPFEFLVMSTTARSAPLGEAFPIAGGSSVEWLLQVVSVSGNASAIPALAFAAARPDVPDAFAVVSGTVASAQGFSKFSSDLSATTDKYLALPGISTKLTSGSGPGTIKGVLTAILHANQVPAGERTLEVPPGLGSTVIKYPIGRVPAVNASKIRGALVGSDLAANVVDWRLQARGVNDPEAPGAWVAQGAGVTQLTSTTVAACISDTTISGITLTDYEWLDVALGLALHTGQSGPTGTLRCSLSVSYT